MALYGSITADNKVVAAWVARRLDPVLSAFDAAHRYDVEVSTIDGKVWNALVMHRYSDGPIALARLALSIVPDEESRLMGFPRDVQK